MSDLYKVRMMVLAMVQAEDDIDAKDEARLVANEGALHVLSVEEPEKLPPMRPYGSKEEDIYP